MKLVAIALRGLWVAALCWSAIGCASPSGHHRTELQAGPTGIRLSSESVPKEKTLKVQLPPGACACVSQYDAGGHHAVAPTNLASPGGSVALAASARTVKIEPYVCDDATARNPCTQPAGASGVGGPSAQSLARRTVWMHALPDEAGQAQWLSVIASGAESVVTGQLLELMKSGPGAACPPNLEIEFWANASPYGVTLYETEPLVALPVELNGHSIDLATTFDGCWFRSTCVFPIEQLDLGVPSVNTLVIPYEAFGKPCVEYRIEHEVE